MPQQAQSMLGLILIPLLAWALSEKRAAVGGARMLRIVGAGLALQLGIAGAMLNVPPLRALFEWPAAAVAALQAATGAGVQIVFGYLAGGPAPFEVVRPEHGFVLAFQALPLILVVSALSRLLYHWGILQRVVRAFAWMLQRSLGVSGPVGTSAAANIFVGMIEAPLFIRPYLASMSRGGLFATMTVGMAGIAGTVLALYASILEPKVAGAAGHLIVASVISVPAALMLAALMVPDERAGEAPSGPIDLAIDEAASSMDAIARGTREGVDLLANVAAMLIVIVALVALANQILAGLSDPIGVRLTFEQMLGWCFAPLAWLIGIPWAEATSAGGLLGTKMVLNELVAYLQLSALPPEALAGRSRLILTYALCGFANLGSLGIMIGGIAAMVPERRSEIVELGSKTLISGTLATLMTGAVVGLLTPG